MRLKGHEARSTDIVVRTFQYIPSLQKMSVSAGYLVMQQHERRDPSLGKIMRFPADEWKGQCKSFDLTRNPNLIEPYLLLTTTSEKWSVSEIRPSHTILFETPRTIDSLPTSRIGSVTHPVYFPYNWAAPDEVVHVFHPSKWSISYSTHWNGFPPSTSRVKLPK